MAPSAFTTSIGEKQLLKGLPNRLALMDAEVGRPRPLDERTQRSAGKPLIRRVGALFAVLVLLAGCSGKESGEPEKSSPPPSPAAVTPEQARAIAKEAYIYGFPMVDNYRVQYAYFVNKRDPRVQGRLERDPQHRKGVHARGQGDSDAELGHPLLGGGRRPAYRTAGADRPADRTGPVLLAAVRRRLHLQLRLCRQPHHGQRRRQIPAGRAELEGRQARGRQRGHSLRHRPGLRAVPHAAVRAVGSRRRQEGPVRLPGHAAVGVSEPAGARRPHRRSTSFRR